MNRNFLLAATCALLLLGACTEFTTAPQPDVQAARDEKPDTATSAYGGGSMGNGN